MSSSVAIEVIIVDDVCNAPEMKRIGVTIVVKMSRGADLQEMNEKITERDPALRDSLNLLYFYDNNGKYDQRQQSTEHRFAFA